MMSNKIDWTKKGQVVNVGFDGNVTSPYFGKSTVAFYVDSDGNYFGCDSTPKYNPITGEKIEVVNNDFAENDYQEYED